MEEVKKYIECIKELIAFQKSNKIDLDKDIVVAVINQVGIDCRNSVLTNNQNNVNKEKIPTESVNMELATEKQKALLKKLGIAFEKQLTKKEADMVIKEYNKNKDY